MRLYSSLVISSLAVRRATAVLQLSGTTAQATPPKKRKRMNVSDDPRLKYSYCRTLQHRCIQTKVALQQIPMLCWSLLCQGLLPHRYHQPSPPEQCLQDCVLGAYLHLGFDSNYATLCKTKKTYRALHCEKALRCNTQTTEVP